MQSFDLPNCSTCVHAAGGVRAWRYIDQLQGFFFFFFYALRNIYLRCGYKVIFTQLSVLASSVFTIAIQCCTKSHSLTAKEWIVNAFIYCRIKTRNSRQTCFIFSRTFSEKAATCSRLSFVLKVCTLVCFLSPCNSLFQAFLQKKLE